MWNFILGAIVFLIGSIFGAAFYAAGQQSKK